LERSDATRNGYQHRGVLHTKLARELSGLQKDEAWRREWCDKAGLGFSIGLHGLQKVVSINTKKAA
jgi:hypothetical protein